MKYENRIAQVDDLQKEINQYRPLKRNALKQLKEYYRIVLIYSSNGGYCLLTAKSCFFGLNGGIPAALLFIAPA